MPALLMCILYIHVKIQNEKLMVPVTIRQVPNLFHSKTLKLGSSVILLPCLIPRDAALILNLLMKKFPFSFTIQVETLRYYLTSQQ